MFFIKNAKCKMKNKNLKLRSSTFISVLRNPFTVATYFRQICAELS